MMYRRKKGDDFLRVGIPRKGLDRSNPEKAIRDAVRRMGYEFDQCEIGDPADIFGPDGSVYYEVKVEGRRKVRTAK